MKRVIAVLLTGLFLPLLVGAPLARAADPMTEWKVEDANLSLSLPSELSVITREGIQSNPEALQQLGLDDDALQQALQEAGAYVDAVAADASHEYMVIVIEPDETDRVWNLNTAPDTLLQLMADELVTQMASQGYTTTYDGTYRVGEVVYTIFSGTATAGGDDYLQYYTIVNGRMTSIALHSYTGALTDAQKETHKQVVDSARFLALVDDPDPSEDPTTGGGLGVLRQVLVIGGIVAAVVVAIAVVVIVLVVRNNRRKRAAASDASTPAAPVPGQPPFGPAAPAPGQPGGYPPAPTSAQPPDSGDRPSSGSGTPTGGGPVSA